MGFSLVVASRDCSLVAVRGLLIAVDSLVDTGSRARGLQSIESDKELDTTEVTLARMLWLRATLSSLRLFLFSSLLKA